MIVRNVHARRGFVCAATALVSLVSAPSLVAGPPGTPQEALQQPGQQTQPHANRQRVRRMGPADRTAVRLTGSAPTVEIPVEFTGNHYILPIRVEGSEPLRVVLDTGMPSPGLMLYDSPATAKLPLQFNPQMQVQVRGAGGSGGGHTAKFAPNHDLSLPGVEITNTNVIVMPPLPGLASLHDGVIGWSLFDNLVVELDPVAKTMRLHDPSQYQSSTGSAEVPFEFERNVPHIELEISTPAGTLETVKVVVDLGAAHALSLNTDASAHIAVPKRHLVRPIGMGVSGVLQGAVGRLAHVGLGGHALRNVVVTFPESRHQNPRGTPGLGGNLGTGILGRFVTAFDYSRKRILLRPTKRLEQPFPSDRTGITLAFGEQLQIEQVIDDSPASRAGLRPGDRITHVDELPVGASDRTRVRERFEGDRPIKIRFQRADQEHTVSVTPRDLI